MTQTKVYVYEAETLAVPPLRMVLVNHDKDRRIAGLDQASGSDAKKGRTRQQIVLKIIECLEDEE